MGRLQTLRLETKIFLACGGITLVVWVLRGVGLLTFLPGVVLSVLIVMSIGSGVVWGLDQIRRF
jgi:hypothetical protein